MQIRRAFKKDIRVIASIEAQTSKQVTKETGTGEPISKKAAEAAWKTYDLTWSRVLIENNQIIGAIHLVDDKAQTSVKKVHKIFLRPEHRGSRGALALINGYKKNVKISVITVGDISWWEENGFVVVAEGKTAVKLLRAEPSDS